MALDCDGWRLFHGVACTYYIPIHRNYIGRLLLQYRLVSTHSRLWFPVVGGPGSRVVESHKSSAPPSVQPPPVFEGLGKVSS